MTEGIMHGHTKNFENCIHNIKNGADGQKNNEQGERRSTLTGVGLSGHGFRTCSPITKF